MSTYCKELIHPLTGKVQIALCRDDHFGRHQYGYGFKKDGSDASLFSDSIDDLDFFTLEQINNKQHEM